VYHGVPTHDHGFEIEAPIVVRVRSDSFEWLLSRSRDMVHKLVVEVSVQGVLRSSSIIRHQLYRSELGVEEGCVVTAKPVLSHGYTQPLRDTYFAEEAVFLAMGLDSSHPRYCLSHTFIAVSI